MSDVGFRPPWVWASLQQIGEEREAGDTVPVSQPLVMESQYHVFSHYSGRHCLIGPGTADLKMRPLLGQLLLNINEPRRLQQM